MLENLDTYIAKLWSDANVSKRLFFENKVHTAKDNIEYSNHGQAVFSNKVVMNFHLAYNREEHTLKLGVMIVNARNLSFDRRCKIIDIF